MLSMLTMLCCNVTRQIDVDITADNCNVFHTLARFSQGIAGQGTPVCGVVVMYNVPLGTALLPAVINRRPFCRLVNPSSASLPAGIREPRSTCRG